MDLCPRTFVISRGFRSELQISRLDDNDSSAHSKDRHTGGYAFFTSHTSDYQTGKSDLPYSPLNTRSQHVRELFKRCH
jgi:hypothetical protein